MGYRKLNLKSDISKLEEQGLKGATFTNSRVGKDKRTLHLKNSKTGEIVYSVYDGVEYDQLENHIMLGANLSVISQGKECILYCRSWEREVFRWERQVDNKRYIDIRGVRDNSGVEVKNIETLPFLPLILSEMTGCRVLIVKNKKTRRIEYIAWLIAGETGLNQRGEVVTKEMLKRKQEYEILLNPMPLEQIREILTSERIQHTTRNIKKEVRSRVLESSIRLQIGIKTRQGRHLTRVKLKEYTEDAGDIRIETPNHDIRLSQQDITNAALVDHKEVS